MASKPIRAQVIVLFFLILANFIAQIPYYLHLYFGSANIPTQIRSIAIMTLVLLFFLIASFLLFKRIKAGYALMLTFTCVEFLFYLLNTLGEAGHVPYMVYHLA